MKLQHTTRNTFLIGLFTAMLLCALPPFAAAQGRCPKDSKLLNGGPTSVFGEGPGTYWGLETNGLNAAGFVTDEQKVVYLNAVFGTSFDSADPDSLGLLRDYNLSQVEEIFDLNGNGYVCVFELRGKRANLGALFSNLTFFSIGDDKIK